MINIIKRLYLVIFFSFISLHANQTIYIGTISYIPEEVKSNYKLFANHLNQYFNNSNINFEVSIPENIEEAINLAKENKLHIFIDSIYPTLILQQAVNTSIEAKRWKNGIEDYNSVIFVRKDSSINNIDDLKNKKITFESSYSTTAYYIPKKVLEKQGYVLSASEKDGCIKYSFSKTDENSIAWVLFKKVDAAATDNISFKQFNQDMFKVIHSSKSFPRHLVSFSQNIHPDSKQKILDILFSMHEKQESKKLLNQFSKTKKFTKLSKNDIESISEFK